MKLKIKVLSLLTVSSFLLLDKASATNFDTSLLAGTSRESDLSRFYINNDVPAGKQTVDIYVNNAWKGRFTLLFGEDRDDIGIERRDAAALGIDMSALPNAAGAGYMPMRQLVQGGSFDFEVATLSLRLTVPQSQVIRAEAGYVDPRFWDRGVPAFLLAYNATYYNVKARNGNKESTDDFYAGLESGANLAGWQFRDSSSFRKSSRQGSDWQNNTRYLQRGFAAIKSNLTAGDFYSPGDLFDSIRVRGGALASDVNMLPNSQQGFSPVVRGVAQSNALVKVLQNGNVIYQENVPPGAFTLDSILPTGSAGDLLVVVKEADGREQSFTVPFSSVPNMLKQGVNKYSVVAGKVHQANTDYTPSFVQGTLQYGFNNLVTGYLGTIYSDDYRSYLLGSGWNLPIGAVSVDVTQASTQLKDRRENGQSFRISYSKFLDATDTNFTLAAYRYSTKGYYSFNDAIYAHEGYRQLDERLREGREADDAGQNPLDMNTWDAVRAARPRNTFNLNLNQRLGEGWGTLYFSGTQRDYWSDNNKSQEYQLGYSNAFERINYNISASRVRNANHQEETRFYLSLSVPLSMFDSNAYLSASLSATRAHYQQSTVSLSGNALESNRLSYAIAGSNQTGGDTMASVNAAYRTRVSTLGASYSESSDYRQTGLSGRGSLVAIPWHLLASNEIGSTMMVVDAPKAGGLMVNGDESIVTNAEGLALVPYATPYRQNSVTLSDTGNSSGAEIVGNIANSVPYAGAVNYLKFETDRRQSYTLRAFKPNGEPLPFGAEVTDQTGKSIGFVGQASMLYLRADQAPTSLLVRLNSGSCRIARPQMAMNATSNVCQ
ncbi:fimbria/pilus outer membrane usher protein [Serratia ficaria]|uniref:Outer membrane usher protein fimD n=1 Tax=Serratia ficaria TaxID=61651 RepID=A0A240BUS8_SERFI|nr:fimbria/pilus outer membrane usher protein [Serratia ficaria]MEE4484105.1 fimbria/pilus outer membrane usher protein [Serratia ficaria]REF45371.1 outer membrane usher protein [Serratia ficaria]CAI0845754.1 Outer membrane usher protein fimD precursor [Serratia ficaria]CAI0888008.1 Outer membrane usher protein fimD precursor [Serratia ficaria]CAI0893162.1 Outer membrane usher protein fimD precursor [Serratia ficaria]